MKVGRPRLSGDLEGMCVTAGCRSQPARTSHTLYEFKQMIASSGVTFREADLRNCGGVTAFLKIAHMAEAFNLPITSHGAHDVTVRLLAAVPNRSYLEVHGFGPERFLTHPFNLEEGFATAPERPGHGVEFDWRGLDTEGVR